jgi:triacylglycerol lipase
MQETSMRIVTTLVTLAVLATATACSDVHDRDKARRGRPSDGISGGENGPPFSSALPMATPSPKATPGSVDQTPESTGETVTLTSYPLVFHHGFLASATVGSFAPAAKRLAGLGYRCFLTQVAPANTIAVRARQLATQIDAVLVATGAAKVNLIAHSMGGLDARYLISTLKYGDRIASLTTLSTPHHGTPLADAGASGGAVQGRAAAALINLFGNAISDDPRLGKADAQAAVANLTTAFVDGEFNAANPDDPRVTYQSWAAATGDSGGDQMKTMLLFSWALLTAKTGANDGMVPVASARWGHFKGVLPADHLDLVGLRLLDRGPFDYDAFYAALANDLAGQGF